MRLFEEFIDNEDFASIPRRKRALRERALAFAGELGYWRQRNRADHALGSDVQRCMMSLERDALRRSESGRLAWAHYLSPGSVLSGLHAKIVEAGDGRCVFILSEGSGSGPAAAILSGYVAGIFDYHVANGAGQTTDAAIVALIEKTNDLIEQKSFAGRFVSILVGIADSNKETITLVTAGSNFPFLWRAGQDSAEVLRLTDAPAAGSFPTEMIASRSNGFITSTFQFLQGDVFIAASDGLSSSRKIATDDDQSEVQEFGGKQIRPILRAVMRRERMALDLGLPGARKLELDFSSATDPVTDVLLALASVETVFRENVYSLPADPAVASFLSRMCPFLAAPQEPVQPEQRLPEPPRDRAKYATVAIQAVRR
jgi:hypothetical protein